MLCDFENLQPSNMESTALVQSRTISLSVFIHNNVNCNIHGASGLCWQHPTFGSTIPKNQDLLYISLLICYRRLKTEEVNIQANKSFNP